MNTKNIAHIFALGLLAVAADGRGMQLLNEQLLGELRAADPSRRIKMVLEAACRIDGVTRTSGTDTVTFSVTGKSQHGQLESVSQTLGIIFDCKECQHHNSRQKTLTFLLEAAFNPEKLETVMRQEAETERVRREQEVLRLAEAERVRREKEAQLKAKTERMRQKKEAQLKAKAETAQRERETQREREAQQKAEVERAQRERETTEKLQLNKKEKIATFTLWCIKSAERMMRKRGIINVMLLKKKEEVAAFCRWCNKAADKIESMQLKLKNEEAAELIRLCTKAADRVLLEGTEIEAEAQQVLEEFQTQFLPEEKVVRRRLPTVSAMTWHQNGEITHEQPTRECIHRIGDQLKRRDK
jgi:hypothetical protein